MLSVFRRAVERLRGRFDLGAQKQEEKKANAANPAKHPPKRKRRR